MERGAIVGVMRSKVAEATLVIIVPLRRKGYGKRVLFQQNRSRYRTYEKEVGVAGVALM